MDLIVDPGSRRCGVCCFPAGPIPFTTKMLEPTTAQTIAVLRWFRSVSRAGRLVLEAQHVRLHGSGKQQINWPSVEALLLSAHRWVVLAELEGIDIERVQPAEWQGPSFKTVPAKDSVTKKKLSTKQRSKLVAVTTWTDVGRLDLDAMLSGRAHAAFGATVSSAKLTVDESDAAVMGRWWQLTGRASRSAG